MAFKAGRNFLKPVLPLQRAVHPPQTAGNVFQEKPKTEKLFYTKFEGFFPSSSTAWIERQTPENSELSK